MKFYWRHLVNRHFKINLGKVCSLNNKCVDMQTKKVSILCISWHTAQYWHLYLYFSVDYKDLKECVNQISLYWKMYHCVVCYGCQPISICHTSAFISCCKSSSWVKLLLRLIWSVLVQPWNSGPHFPGMCSRYLKILQTVHFDEAVFFCLFVAIPWPTVE